MSLELKQDKEQLIQECSLLGICLDNHSKQKRDLIKSLQWYSVKCNYGSSDVVPWSLRQMLYLESPMLCKRYSQCSKKQIDSLWYSNKYIVEQKIDGFRMLVFYDSSKNEFNFYSRDISENTYLPISYKEYIRVLNTSFSYPYSFILDCEVLLNKDKEGNVIESKKKSYGDLLIYDRESQHISSIVNCALFSEEGVLSVDTLTFIVFDCVYHNSYLVDRTWSARHIQAESLIDVMRGFGFNCEMDPVVYQDKFSFYSDIVEHNLEGVVFKNVNSPYRTGYSRTADMVKLKINNSSCGIHDIDAWITGGFVSDKCKSFPKTIDSLVFSCNVQFKDGHISEHEIGVCSDICPSLAESITIYNKDIPMLNPDFLGRVATLSGSSVNLNNFTITHCVIDQWRYDKTKLDCETLMECDLIDHVIFAGGKQ